MKLKPVLSSMFWKDTISAEEPEKLSLSKVAFEIIDFEFTFSGCPIGFITSSFLQNVSFYLKMSMSSKDAKKQEWP